MFFPFFTENAVFFKICGVISDDYVCDSLSNAKRFKYSCPSGRQCLFQGLVLAPIVNLVCGAIFWNVNSTATARAVMNLRGRYHCVLGSFYGYTPYYSFSSQDFDPQLLSLLNFDYIEF